MEKLLFVYNAKSDIIHSIFDYAHKIIQPSSFSCSLCKLTHGNFSEKKDWKQFRQEVNIEMEFYHIDEFEAIYPKSNSYPVVFKDSNNELQELISTEYLSQISTTQELINLLNIYLK